MNDEPQDPMDPAETMMATMRASVEAMMSTVRDAVRPLFAVKVREILERNEGIVDQRTEVLEHLTNEIVDAIFSSSDGLDFDFGE
jgi:hypothetical protein